MTIEIFDLIFSITDLMILMGDLIKIKGHSPTIAVIIITGYSDMKLAVKLIELVAL